MNVSNLLDSSPDHRGLLQYFFDRMTLKLVPHNQPLNPLRTILVPMALHNEGLLSVLLAAAGENRAVSRRNPSPEVLIRSLLSRGYETLRMSFNDQSLISTDEILALLAAFVDHEVSWRKTSFTRSWRVYLQMASKVIESRQQDIRESKRLRFLIKWLAYFDVIASITSPKYSTLFKGAYWVFDDDPEDEYVLDPYMGFLQIIMPSLIQIGEVIRMKRQQTDTASEAEVNELAAEIEKTREMMNKMRESPRHAFVPAGTSEELSLQLQACAAAYYNAGMLHFYRRVEDVPTESILVQTEVKNILYLINQIPSGSGPETALLFPLFTAGCEVIDESDRDFILMRLENLEKLGSGNSVKAIEVLGRIWKARSDGSSKADVVLYDPDLDLNLA